MPGDKRKPPRKPARKSPRPLSNAGGRRARSQPAADARRQPEERAEKEPPKKPVRVPLQRPTIPASEIPRGLRPLPPDGAWIFACREGYEIDLIEELQLARAKGKLRILAPGLLSYEGTLPRPPALREGRIELTFARQGFPLGHSIQGDDRFAERIASALAERAPARGPVTFQWFVPDSDHGNLLSQPAAKLGAEVERQLERALPDRVYKGDPRRAGGQLAQLCLVEEYLAFTGALPAATSVSPYPGGRARMAVSARAPSRAAMKLAEAFDWLGVTPEPGDTCIDLGAAPGGWTFLLVEMRAKVIAVDPGRLRSDLAQHKLVTSIHKSAFDYHPEGPVEWLFCDMAWRPLEVAALLARWGRRRLARTLVANIKLPMKRKAEFVARVKEIVETGGWSNVRTRHLYHDREEITLTGWRK